MTDLITFPDNNGKYAVYKEGYINGIYCYLDIIGTPTTLTTAVQCSHHFSPSYSINNNAETLQPVIASICTRHNL